ncbi:hypothetical protein [Macrococcoides caseolyticum]|nr:hypothetical protein [Macrococcus caseolyticus]
MKAKLSEPIKMVQTGSKRVWYYKDFKVYTRVANTNTTEQD